MSIGESDVGSINYIRMLMHNKVPINIHKHCNDGDENIFSSSLFSSY
jgi:hypothetical protein